MIFLNIFLLLCKKKLDFDPDPESDQEIPLKYDPDLEFRSDKLDIGISSTSRSIIDLLWNPGEVDVRRSVLSRPEPRGEHAHAQVHSVQVLP